MDGGTWDGEMLVVVDVAPDVCAPPPPPPAEIVVVECWEDDDEDEGELPRAFPPPLFPVEDAEAPVCVAFAAFVVADDEDADALDGVFGFELRICAQVGFDGDG